MLVRGSVNSMLKRLYIYYKERYPIFLRLLLGLIVFGEIYFIVLLNQGVTHFNIGVQEIIGSYTVFAFLLWLRVADDLKDHRTDKILFPDRPLAAGKTKIEDVTNDAKDAVLEKVNDAKDIVVEKTENIRNTIERNTKKVKIKISLRTEHLKESFKGKIRKERG